LAVSLLLASGNFKDFDFFLPYSKKSQIDFHFKVNAEEANFGRKSNRVQMLNNAVAKIKTLSGGRVGTGRL
jgi:hypothetical protein